MHMKLNELIEQLQAERDKLPETDNPEVLCASATWTNHVTVLGVSAQTVLYPCILIHVEAPEEDK
ncbi:MAG TPA: hypothetical protein VF290_02485 [Pyrinomonadaceae bacterium]